MKNIMVNKGRRQCLVIPEFSIDDINTGHFIPFYALFYKRNFYVLGKNSLLLHLVLLNQNTYNLWSIKTTVDNYLL